MIKFLLYTVGEWIDNILGGLALLLFPIKRAKNPRLTKLFSFAGVNYYTYASVEEMPIKTVSRLFFCINALYMNFPNANVIKAGVARLETQINSERVSLLKLSETTNSIKEYLDWRFNGEAFIEALCLLLLPNKRENPMLIKAHMKHPGFKKFVHENAVLLGLNSILLNPSAFYKYLELQALECERLGASNEELRRVGQHMKEFLNLFNNVKEN
jgi:hypothetical protein